MSRKKFNCADGGRNYTRGEIYYFEINFPLEKYIFSQGEIL